MKTETFLSLISDLMLEFESIEIKENGYIIAWGEEFSNTMIKTVEIPLESLLVNLLDDITISQAITSSKVHQRHWITSGVFCDFDFTLCINHEGKISFSVARRYSI